MHQKGFRDSFLSLMPHLCILITNMSGSPLIIYFHNELRIWPHLNTTYTVTLFQSTIISCLDYFSILKAPIPYLSWLPISLFSTQQSKCFLKPGHHGTPLAPNPFIVFHLLQHTDQIWTTLPSLPHLFPFYPHSLPLSLLDQVNKWMNLGSTSGFQGQHPPLTRAQVQV